MRGEVLGGLLLLAACEGGVLGSSDDTAVDPGATDTATGDTDPWTPPDAPGAFEAGTAEHTAPGPDGLALPVQAWFPAEAPGSARHVYDGELSGQAWGDATPACDAPRPVVVFSHGNLGQRWHSAFLAEALAAHGWVVVAPDHVGNTAADGTAPFGEVVLRRPRDVAATFDWVAAEVADPASPYHGCADPEAGYAVVGHSLGGFTALATAGAWLDIDGLAAACLAAPGYFLCPAAWAWQAEHPGSDRADRSDPRVWATAPLAPAGVWGFQEGLTAVEVPTLVVGGRTDAVTPWATEVEPIYHRLATTPRYLAGLEGAGHFAFTEICQPGWDGCTATDLDVATVHALTTTLVLAHLDVARGEERAADWLPPSSPHLLWRQVTGRSGKGG